MHTTNTTYSHVRICRGFNLVEAAIVLGVVGLVIGGIWSVASTIYEKNNYNNFMQDVALLAQDIKQNFGAVTTWRTSSTMSPYCKPFFQGATGTGSIFYDKRLGSDVYVTCEYWPPGAHTSRLGLSLDIFNVKKSACQNLIPKFLPLISGITILGTTYSAQEVINMQVDYCLSANRIQIDLSNYVPSR